MAAREALDLTRELRGRLRRRLGGSADSVLGSFKQRSFVDIGIRQDGDLATVRVWSAAANRQDPPAIDWRRPLEEVLRDLGL